jgi:hypothetical protein
MGNHFCMLCVLRDTAKDQHWKAKVYGPKGIHQNLGSECMSFLLST